MSNSNMELASPLDTHVYLTKAPDDLYMSIQGEGRLVGRPTVFIRFQGCSWRCTWCDSRHTWPEGGVRTSVKDIVLFLKEHPGSDVCITGGEPLQQPLALKALAIAISTLDRIVEVKTSGLEPIPKDLNSFVDSWAIDLKCPVSGMEGYNRYEELEWLREKDQVNFVVCSEKDLTFSKDVKTRYPTKAELFLSPVFPLRGSPPVDWLRRVASFAVEEGFSFSLQMHKILWGNERGR